MFEENGDVAAEIKLAASKDWEKHTASIKAPVGQYSLFFRYKGSGKCDVLEIELA